MIFLHGWPGIGLLWRAQLEAFAAEGWHCVAPDMRGYGNSTAPSALDAYTVEQIVADMVALHEHLGSQPAIWVGHDCGKPGGQCDRSTCPGARSRIGADLGPLFSLRLCIAEPGAFDRS